jgi:hypothetical protein
MPKKWFDPKPKSEIVIQHVPTANISTEDIDALASEMQKKCVNTITAQFILSRALQPPRRRLAINLRALYGELMYNDGRNVLIDGLSDTERGALVDLQMRSCSIKGLTTAHAIFNVAERTAMMETFNQLYEALRK